MNELTIKQLFTYFVCLRSLDFVFGLVFFFIFIPVLIWLDGKEF